jgi:biotin carboxyl carrier protein
VMKMVMPLLAPMAGVITCVMPEGSAMTGGDLIARLVLDDASSVSNTSG